MVNFFDLGTHKGQEIDYLIKNLNNVPMQIYAFEANPDLCLLLKEKYKTFSHIHVFNLAISSVDGKIDLYKCDTEDACGSSIYRDKRNVTDTKYTVDSNKFSTWILRHNIQLKNCVNILKSNIEGADFDLFLDLEKEDLIKYFNLFLCSHEQGFSRDMRKIKSLAARVNELDSLMKRNKIKQEIFTLLGDGSKNINLIERISWIMSQYTRQ